MRDIKILKQPPRHRHFGAGRLVMYWKEFLPGSYHYLSMIFPVAVCVLLVVI